MNEENKRILYNQLVELKESNLEDIPIPTWEEYIQLSAKEALKCIFDYRDYKYASQDNASIFIELPDLDLEGQDLSDVFISDFFPSVEQEDGKIIPSKLNLKDTNAIIDVNKIGITEIDGTRAVLDFENIDFRGCDLYGMLPNDSENIKYIDVRNATEEHLDKRYLNRRNDMNKDLEKKSFNDRVFKRLKEGKDLTGLKGIAGRNEIDLRDYDLIGFDRERLEEALTILHLEYIMRSNLKVCYLGEFITKREYQKGNFEFFEKFFKIVDKEYLNIIIIKGFDNNDYKFVDRIFNWIEDDAKREIVQLGYKKENIEFVDKHFFCLEEKNQKQILQSEYEKGNLKFVGKYFAYLDENDQKQILQSEYEKGNLKFVGNHFAYLDENDQKQILQSEYEKENLDFVDSQFYYLDEDYQKQILQLEYEKGNLEFVEKYFNYLEENYRDQKLQSEYKKGNIQFVENNLEYASDDIIESIVLDYFNIEEKDFGNGILDDKDYKNIMDKAFKAYDKGLVQAVSVCNRFDYYDCTIEKLVNLYLRVLAKNKSGYSIYYRNIKDDEKRKNSLMVLLKAIIRLHKHISKKIDNSSLVQNNNELLDIIEKLKEKGVLPDNAYEKEVAVRKEKEEQKINDYFLKELCLSEEQFDSLKKEYTKYGSSIYESTVSLEKIKMQQIIYENCGVEKNDFCNLRCLTQDPRVLYARMRFFKEKNIRINKEKPVTTLAMSKKAFASNFGYDILGISVNGNEILDVEETKRKLLEKYPMPRTIEELKEELSKEEKEEVK